MDSVTQFVLGSGIAAAVLAPRIGARKAVLLGGVLGTLPDLDVFLPFEDQVDAFVSHRGATHSFFVHILAAPIFAELSRLLFQGLRAENRLRLYMAVFAVFATHAVIDAMTIYGTRLFWPFWPEPVGIGSVFIIDPLYTVPLLIVSLWGLIADGWGELLRKWTVGALILSSVYLGWSLVGQSWATARAQAALERAGLAGHVSSMITTPLPFTTFMWRSIAILPGGYLNIYDSLAGPSEEIKVYHQPSLAAGCLADDPKFLALSAFAKGFWSLRSMPDGDIVYSDLRMGVTPNFAFMFKVAARQGDVVTPVPPTRVAAASRTEPGDQTWLRGGLSGALGMRQSEEGTLLSGSVEPLPSLPAC